MNLLRTSALTLSASIALLAGCESTILIDAHNTTQDAVEIRIDSYSRHTQSKFYEGTLAPDSHIRFEQPVNAESTRGYKFTVLPRSTPGVEQSSPGASVALPHKGTFHIEIYQSPTGPDLRPLPTK
jgi:hypothetical protein